MTTPDLPERPLTRLDRFGMDVTHRQMLWSYDDCEIVSTNYNHPSITEGQHTNGPAMWWIRSPGGEWVRTGITHKHLLREIWVSCGEECFKDWGVEPADKEGTERE